MEEPVAEELVEHHRGEALRDLGRVDAGGAEPVEVVDLDRRDVLERQDPPRRALPRDLREAHARVVGEDLGETLPVLRLVEVVDLLLARDGELLDDRGQVDVVGHEPDAVEPAGDLPERREIDRDDLLDPGTLDLHHDGVESGLGRILRREPRPIRLTEGCRGHGVRVERGVGAVEADSEFSFGERADLRERHRRHLVLQPLELFGDLRREHVQSRGHELPDLDHEPAEVDGEAVETARDPLHAPRAGARGDRGKTEARQEQLVPPRLHHVAQREPQDTAVAGAHVGGVGHQASLIPTRAPGRRRHPAQS